MSNVIKIPKGEGQTFLRQKADYCKLFRLSDENEMYYMHMTVFV